MRWEEGVAGGKFLLSVESTYNIPIDTMQQLHILIPTKSANFTLYAISCPELQEEKDS